MSLPLVFVGHLSEPYFERLRMAARGYSHRQGGLNKKRLGDVMKCAEHMHRHREPEIRLDRQELPSAPHLGSIAAIAEKKVR